MHAPVALAEDRLPRRPLATTMWFGTGRAPGRTVARIPGGGWRRAERTATGPLVLEVRPTGDQLVLQVWGLRDTPPAVVEQALGTTRRWAGLADDPTGFAELVGPNPVLRRALQVVGTPLLGELPRASESFGRAVLGQLVQGIEAARSAAELVRRLGVATDHGVWIWPTSRAIGSTPAHDLRTCGIALRSAGALHRFVAIERDVERLRRAGAWTAVDQRLRALPGVGVWTAAETRLYLGDADAVSYGDYHIPALVGWALGDRTETDEAMAELLAPYAPQRGRVIRLLERAGRRGLVDVKPRRGPRSPVSAHRYW